MALAAGRRTINRANGDPPNDNALPWHSQVRTVMMHRLGTRAFLLVLLTLVMLSPNQLLAQATPVGQATPSPCHPVPRRTARS
jgi:hypothetical protein